MEPIIEQDESDFHALVQAFVMIVVSEIGDKTFLIAAIMATRHARLTVFGGAFASLVVMSILSAALGKVILGLIPKVLTLWAACLLFLVFGVKMLQEALAMSSGHMAEEMREVEEELDHDSSRHDSQNARGMPIPLEDLEEGKSTLAIENGSALARPGSPRPSSRQHSPSGRRSGGIAPAFPLSNGSGKKEKEGWKSTMDGVRNILMMVTSPVFAQAFVLTFLGEWGDRSQITTIAMGGAHSIPVIAFGTIMGHGLCTAGAVIGGRLLSTRISVKHISLGGACAFLIFGVLYALEAWSTPWDALTGGESAMYRRSSSI